MNLFQIIRVRHIVCDFVDGIINIDSTSILYKLHCQISIAKLEKLIKKLLKLESEKDLTFNLYGSLVNDHTPYSRKQVYVKRKL